MPSKRPAKISVLRMFLIYSVPLLFVVAFFPYRDPIYLENQYPFNASFSGTTILTNVGFSPIPPIIPTYSKPPLLSAIGIPIELFDYETCIRHVSVIVINGQAETSNVMVLDVKVKTESQTMHLPPNATVCRPPDDRETPEISDGDLKYDSNDVAALLTRNHRQPIHGMTTVMVFARPVYGKRTLFLAVIFTLYPLYWAAIIAWHTVHQFIFVSKKMTKISR